MLVASGLIKRYGASLALDGASLTLAPGEVVGLVGENGAGKSTLIKLLCGLIQPEAGSMTLDGRAYRPRSPREAALAGLAVIHQERHVLENLTVRENLMLGHEPRIGPFVDKASSRRLAASALERAGVALPLEALGGSLSNAERQLLEVAKALSQNARIVIMDEPTSSLSTSEAERLLDLVAQLKAQGKSVLYVTHRLAELVRAADRVVGLRDGRPAGELPRDRVTAREMVQLMVGREVVRAARASRQPGEAILKTENLRTLRRPAASCSFEVRAGEIVGMAGLVGAGRSEIARALFGVDRRAGGRVWMDGRELREGSPREAIDRGLFLAPEDRKGQGILLDLSIQDNIVLPSIPAWGPWADERAALARAEGQKASLSLKCRSVHDKAGSLSGGNQQKAVLGRWLALRARCLILDEPTCGIDVGARSEIYRIVSDLAERGAAILMISSDLDELMAMSDRVLVFHEGRLAGELNRDQFSEAAIMALAVGHG